MLCDGEMERLVGCLCGGEVDRLVGCLCDGETERLVGCLVMRGVEISCVMERCRD